VVLVEVDSSELNLMLTHPKLHKAAYSPQSTACNSSCAQIRDGIGIKRKETVSGSLFHKLLLLLAASNSLSFHPNTRKKFG
jgi:hypothetical protein